MIKINLVGQRKRKKAREAEGSQKTVFVGMAAIGAAAVAVFLLLHQPVAAAIDDLKAENKKLDATKKKLEDETKNLKTLRAEKAADETRWQSISKLDSARAVPAWLMWELSNLLTRNHSPSVTKKPETEQWLVGWDSKHAWLISFQETGGRFTLEGGAQSDSDATQLALRMQASMFFDGVSPKGGSEETDRDSGLTYYKFTITGTVRY